MNYIIFDLEWNNYYNYKYNTALNEIIEIGAVKLNSNLEIVDTFKQLIKPKLTKKLGSRCKNLTHITMEEINKNGIDFDAAFSDFARWSGGSDTVFLSWSNSDLYTLVENFKRFSKISNLSFISNYADAQSYCMRFVDNHNGNQISLSNCAEKFGIDIDTENLHRALEDCFVTAYCFKKVYDKKIFADYIHSCDKAYFERLVFKPYYIKEPVYKSFNINNVELICENCHGKIVPAFDFEFRNNSFRSAGQCEKCNRKFWIYIRAKQTYDEIAVSTRIMPMSKKRAKHI